MGPIEPHGGPVLVHGPTLGSPGLKIGSQFLQAVFKHHSAAFMFACSYNAKITLIVLRSVAFNVRNGKQNQQSLFCAKAHYIVQIKLIRDFISHVDI